MIALVVVVLLGLGAGFVINRWWAVPLPLVGFLTYSIGRKEGWWGCCGVGDGWLFASIALGVVGAVGLAVGVACRRTVSRSPARTS